MSVAVDNVMSGGAPSVDAVYQACGVAPKCGRCKVDIQRMLDAANAAQCPLAAE